MSQDHSSLDFLSLANQVLAIEISALSSLNQRLNDEFNRACEHLMQVKGRVIVMGMGKSGHVGRKIAATFASTGTPAFFVHPGEASHGDLGMITADDVVVGISYSGEADELLVLLPVIKRLGVALIAMTGKSNSTLARQADVTLDIAVEKEACPLNLAPTASTTVTLALGDALAVALLHARGFNAEDFARSHPGGKLGKRLLTYLADVMRQNGDIPINGPTDTLATGVVTMTSKGMGFTIVAEANRVLGVFTDGDLRRLFETHQLVDVQHIQLCEVMTTSPATIAPNVLAEAAFRLMETKKISALPVVDDDQRLLGAVSMLDLLNAGID